MLRAETDNTWLMDLPPTVRQRWSAAAVSILLVVGFGIAAPFADRPLAQLNAFFPSLDAVVFVTDIITATLLFAQLAIFYSAALLALASGYLFTALIVIPHALTFSGAFSPTGLLGASDQTGSWLFIFWHAGFAVALLAYAVLRQDTHLKTISEASTLTIIAVSAVSMVCLVLGLTWLATAGAIFLPTLVVDKSHLSSFVHYPIGLTIAISASAFAILWTRRRTVLDQWLMVVTLASILELAFSGLLPSVRFSLGFYVGRVFSLVTSSVVLVVLLAETMRLYVLLARSNAMLRREQANKLMSLEALASSIAHELKQPLSAMILHSGIALRLIEMEPPDVAEASSTLRDVKSDGERTHQILESTLALFGKDREKHVQDLIDVNETVRGVFRVLRDELVYHGVTARMKLAPQLPLITGHRGQLQELFINVIQNAIEALDDVERTHRVLTVRTADAGGKTIVAEVEDSGPGIDPINVEKVFDAFVTTKPNGTGLGLALCRMIVDRHGGRISASPIRPHGSIIRIELPQKTTATAAS